jgi:hypothetical protein
LEAQQQGGDLTMTILYQWAKECSDIPQLSDCLRRDCMNRCLLVQFLNQQLLKIRTTNVHFPKILLNPNQKERFIWILEENKDSINYVLNDEWIENERKNIA